MREWHTVIWIIPVHQIQSSDDDVGDLDLEGVLGDIFSGYTSLTQCCCVESQCFYTAGIIGSGQNSKNSSNVKVEYERIYCTYRKNIYDSLRTFLPEHDSVTFGYMLSQIGLSVVCNVRAPLLPTQPVEICSNVSSPFSTLAIRRHPCKIVRISTQ